MARMTRVLDEMPDLAEGLTAAEFEAAAQVALGAAERIDRGLWTPTFGDQIGGIVSDGVLLRTCGFSGAAASILVGPGDLILEPSATGAWTALQPVTIIWLGAPFERAMQRWPSITRSLLRLVQEGAERSMALQAIVQRQRVDERLLALLWLLAERWGRMTRDGVVLELRLQHRVLADLIGARRPSVTTALGALTAEGRVVRRAGGGWLLRDAPPALPLAAGAEDAGPAPAMST